MPQRLRGNPVRRSLQVRASGSKENDRVLTGVRLLQDMSMSSEDSSSVSSASGDSSADSSSEDNDRVLTGVRLLQDMSMSSEDSGDVSSASGDSSVDSSSED